MESVNNIRKLSSSVSGGSLMWCLSHRIRFLNERGQRISTLPDQQRYRYIFESLRESSCPKRHSCRIAWPWRWWHYDSSKRRYLVTAIDGVTSQQMRLSKIKL
jgi:hypothetical protein